jgi:hypothetical protein
MEGLMKNIKKNPVKFSICLLLVFFVFSCQKKRYTEITELYQNGKKKIEQEYIVLNKQKIIQKINKYNKMNCLIETSN